MSLKTKPLDGFMGNMLRKLNKQYVNPGFTLIEILLSVALIGALSFLSLPLFRTLISKNDNEVATNTVIQTLRRAQLLSQAVDGDISWGVKVQSGSITLFKGVDYALRDQGFDEVFEVPNTIGVGGTSEVIFTKFTGIPQTTGTITFASENETNTISINEKGTISF